VKLTERQRDALGAIIYGADRDRDGYWWPLGLHRAPLDSLQRRGLIAPGPTPFTDERGLQRYWVPTPKGRAVFAMVTGRLQLNPAALLDLYVALSDALPTLEREAGKYAFGDEDAQKRHHAAVAALAFASRAID
jgi:hypothetical protein